MTTEYKQGDRVEVLEPQLFDVSRWRKGTVESFTKSGKPRVKPDGSEYLITVLKPHRIRK